MWNFQGVFPIEDGDFPWPAICNLVEKFINLQWGGVPISCQLRSPTLLPGHISWAFGPVAQGPKKMIHQNKTSKNAGITLPETNLAPENGWLEYQFPFGMAYFQGIG